MEALLILVRASALTEAHTSLTTTSHSGLAYDLAPALPLHGACRKRRAALALVLLRSPPPPRSPSWLHTLTLSGARARGGVGTPLHHLRPHEHSRARRPHPATAAAGGRRGRRDRHRREEGRGGDGRAATAPREGAVPSCEAPDPLSDVYIALLFTSSWLLYFYLSWQHLHLARVRTVLKRDVYPCLCCVVLHND